MLLASGMIGMKMCLIGCSWLAMHVACESVHILYFCDKCSVQTCSVSTLLTGLPHDVVGCVTMMMGMVTAPFHPTGVRHMIML